MVPHCNRSWPGSTVLCDQSTPTSRRTATGPFSGLTSQGSSSPSLLSLLASTSKEKCDPTSSTGRMTKLGRGWCGTHCSPTCLGTRSVVGSTLSEVRPSQSSRPWAKDRTQVSASAVFCGQT